MQKRVKYPPMGWNSFDAYGWSVTEEEILKNAEFVDKNLKPFGYEYITVDFCWSHPGADCRDNPLQSETFAPELHMDMYGRVLPSVDRFPSAIWTGGFHELSDKIHGMGLKFAIHIMRGVPRQAAAMKTLIKGTNITADAIAMTRPEDCCAWLTHMYGINMDKPGAQEYLNSLFELYADWGVDLIKVDDIAYPYRDKEIEGYRRAIDQCGRAMILSLSPGEALPAKSEHLSKNADMWRISADFWDRWSDLVKLSGLFDTWSKIHKGPGFPDGDMIPFSRLGLRGPMDKPRYSRFTHDEKRLLMSLWAINNSPLILGGDLTAMDADALAALTNPDVLAMDRYAAGGKKAVDKDGVQVWTALDSACPGIAYAAVLNMGEGMKTVNLNAAELFGREAESALELWSGVPSGGGVCGVIRPHGVMLLRLILK